MNKHTPGPWTVSDDMSHLDEEEKANTILMSAAPDLLRACKLLLAERDTEIDTDTMLAFGPAFAAARAAVKKAEGDE